jgi:hypothetical protein
LLRFANVRVGTTSTSASTLPENADEGEWRSKTKNRRQLTWANTRAFAWRYIRERMYVGRFGKGQTGEVCAVISFFPCSYSVSRNSYLPAYVAFLFFYSTSYRFRCSGRCCWRIRSPRAFPCFLSFSYTSSAFSFSFLYTSTSSLPPHPLSFSDTFLSYVWFALLTTLFKAWRLVALLK